MNLVKIIKSKWVFIASLFLAQALCALPASAVQTRYAWSVHADNALEINNFFEQADFSHCAIKTIGLDYGFSSVAIEFIPHAQLGCIAVLTRQFELSKPRATLCTVEEITAAKWASTELAEPNMLQPYVNCNSLQKSYQFAVNTETLSTLNTFFDNTDFNHCAVDGLVLNYPDGVVSFAFDYVRDITGKHRCQSTVSFKQNGQHMNDYCTLDEWKAIDWLYTDDGQLRNARSIGFMCKQQYKNLSYDVSPPNAKTLNELLQSGMVNEDSLLNVKITYPDSTQLKFRKIAKYFDWYYVIEATDGDGHPFYVRCEYDNFKSLGWIYDPNGLLRHTKPQLNVGCSEKIESLDVYILNWIYNIIFSFFMSLIEG